MGSKFHLSTFADRAPLEVTTPAFAGKTKDENAPGRARAQRSGARTRNRAFPTITITRTSTTGKVMGCEGICPGSASCSLCLRLAPLSPPAPAATVCDTRHDLQYPPWRQRARPSRLGSHGRDDPPGRGGCRRPAGSRSAMGAPQHVQGSGGQARPGPTHGRAGDAPSPLPSGPTDGFTGVLPPGERWPEQAPGQDMAQSERPGHRDPRAKKDTSHGRKNPSALHKRHRSAHGDRWLDDHVLRPGAPALDPVDQQAGRPFPQF